MPTFTSYKSWSQVQDDAQCMPAGLWYHAPLDTHPVRVIARKLYQNGKIRFEAPDGTRFTADPDHLSRFRVKDGETGGLTNYRFEAR